MPQGALTAAAIMARTAANQDRADEARRHYVYVQHARVLSRKGKTVMCEEVTDSRVTPSDAGSHAELFKLTGRTLHKHGYVSYSALAPEVQKQAKESKDNSVTVEVNDEMDRDLVENLRGHLIDDKSKDGIGAHLFPLTSKAQQDYVFRLIGRERMNGREVFHVDFLPKDNDDLGAWKGTAYIDVTDFEPVVVRTSMARRIPFAVRTLLGTNVPGLGFTIVYAPQPDGVWFPISFGTEFKIHVLYFFHREIVLDAQNRDFEKTHVSAKIVDGDPARY